MSNPAYTDVLRRSIALTKKLKKALESGIGRSVRVKTGKGEYFFGTITNGRVLGTHIEITVTAKNGATQEFQVENIPSEYKRAFCPSCKEDRLIDIEGYCPECEYKVE